jgi:hypothetical protein
MAHSLRCTIAATVIKNNNHYILALIFVPGKKLASLYPSMITCKLWCERAPRAANSPDRSLFSSILRGEGARVCVHCCK